MDLLFSQNFTIIILLVIFSSLFLINSGTKLFYSLFIFSLWLIIYTSLFRDFSFHQIISFLTVGILVSVVLFTTFVLDLSQLKISIFLLLAVYLIFSILRIDQAFKYLTFIVIYLISVYVLRKIYE